MKRTRQVLVMTLVATALCADRVVTAAPTLRESLAADPLARLATNLASRFTRTFRRATTASVRLHEQPRQKAPSAPGYVPPAVACLALFHTVDASAFPLRLPPPAR